MKNIFATRTTVLSMMLLASLILSSQILGQRPSKPAQGREYDRALELYSQGEVLRKTDTVAAKRAALEKYISAAAIYGEVGSRSDEAATLHMIGYVYTSLGENKTALTFYDRALPIFRAAGDRKGEAHLLLNIGAAYSSLGEGKRTLDYSIQALSIQQAIGDKPGAANSLTDIGSSYNALNEHKKALEYLDQALPLHRAIANRSGEGVTLFNIGLAYGELGDNRKAIGYYDQALALLKAVGNKAGEAATIVNLGGIYNELGENQRALEYFNQAISIIKIIGDKHSEASTLHSIGALYAELSENQKAIEYYGQALTLLREVGDRNTEADLLSNIGLLHASVGDRKTALEFFNRALPLEVAVGDRNGEANTLSYIGLINSSNGDTRTALDYLNRALSVKKAIGDLRGQATTLHNIGVVYDDSGEMQKALDYYTRALPIRKAVGDLHGEAITLGNIGFGWQFLGNRRFAVFYLKQSVNRYQALRQGIQGLDKETRQSYLKKIEESYKVLADLLIAEGRLPEAQAVLAMLKEEEVFEYVRRDAAETDKLKKRVDLREDEKIALARYEELAAKLGSIGAEFGKLHDAKNKLAEGQSLSPGDQKRYDELSRQLEDASTVFQVFLRELAEEFSKKPKIIEEIQENTGLQADLRSWGEGVVSLYTVLGEDRYRVILTTPNAQTDGKTEIRVADLNKKVAAFRAAIQNPRVDPRPLGKELYDIIVKPVETQLEGAKARTLLWSLDGSLRYVPLAALWDGKQYFGQKYQNVIITLASRTRLSDVPVGDWRVLGLGVTGAKQLVESGGSRVFNFAALPGVRSELSAIVRDEQGKNEIGIISGKRLLDADFTEQALKDRLSQQFKVVHISSHFLFRPGDITRSFLLLGDGTALTMDKIRTSPQLKFNGVELLTLSACDTAVGEADANGKEVESFAVIAQQNGAKAVMATLWPVADESTSLFMSEFYRLKKDEPATSKAEAIRLAQKAMIYGRIKSSGTSNGCRAETFAGGPKPNEFKCDPNAPFSHPYFWSPFVLIGNWR